MKGEWVREAVGVLQIRRGAALDDGKIKGVTTEAGDQGKMKKSLGGKTKTKGPGFWNNSRQGYQNSLRIMTVVV